MAREILFTTLFIYNLGALISAVRAIRVYKGGRRIVYIRSRYILKNQNCVHQKQVHIAIQNWVHQKQVHFENPEVGTFSKSRSRYILQNQKQVHHKISKLKNNKSRSRYILTIQNCVHQKQVHFAKSELGTAEVSTYCKSRSRYILQNQKQVHFAKPEVGTSTIIINERRRKGVGADQKGREIRRERRRQAAATDYSSLIDM